MTNIPDFARGILGRRQGPPAASGLPAGARPLPLPPSIHPSLAGVRSIVAVASGKGGVGKSTVAVNLAVALQEGGARVGLLDADIYGPSQPGMLGSAGQAARADGERLVPLRRHGVLFISMGLLVPDGAPLIWRAPLAMKIIQQFLADVAWGELDYLLIDLPPGTGDVQLTLAQQAALTGAVIVTTPQRAALDVARKGLRMFSQVSVPILGVIENMSGFTCEHCGQTTAVFKEGGGRRMAGELGVPFLGGLPLDPAIMMSSDDGEPVVARAPDSAAAGAFRAAAASLREEIARAAESSAAPAELAIDATGDLWIRWSDGHPGRHKPYSLRLACACAGCVDETTGERTLDARGVPLDIAVAGVTPVGRYALAINFSDGHRTGIYKHDLLRQICECPECAGKRAGTAAFDA